MALVMQFNPQQLEANIRQIGERAVKGMTVVAKRRVIKIRDLAREYAPIKSGALEHAIEWQQAKGDDRRNVYSVYIDLDAVRASPSGDAVDVGDYAFLMEEGLSPYGSGRYSLGAASRAKRRGGAKVGGKFLKRAVTEGSKGAYNEMVIAVRRVTGDSRTVPMNFDTSTDDE